MYFDHNIRCSKCWYCKKTVETKNDEYEVVAIECTNKNCENVLDDDFWCKYYEGRMVASMAKTYERIQEDKVERENKRVKDVTEKVKETDMVNHPKHYEGFTSIECIENMKLIFKPTRLYDYCIINAYKYLSRHKFKNGKEDLEKAMWYINYASGLLLEFSFVADDLERIMLHDMICEGLKEYEEVDE